MGMVMRNHELVESRAYSYGFAPEVEAWRDVAEDKNIDALASISIEALELSEDLDPSVDLVKKPVMEDLVSSLLGLSLGCCPNPPVRFSPIIPTVWDVQTLSVFSTVSNGRSADRRSKGAIPALKSLLGEGTECASNSALDVASFLVAQQQFRKRDLYQSNWYRNSASDN
ncbi:hypothetical protein AYI68_g3242 [Smittium mucronatum]|uniref:Uncharacterized protein n=1 Tax=Smittium mucronatum TaxID=133383 RepID=A0A1R0H0G3_9FUNG|nr:hypothetical protein AYI68_g3242 [Smittium mucronatum]